MKLKKIPSPNPGLCYNCYFWEIDRGASCNTFRSNNHIECNDYQPEWANIKYSIFKKCVPELSTNIKVL